MEKEKFGQNQQNIIVSKITFKKNIDLKILYAISLIFSF